MNISTLQRISLFVVLLAVQTLVLNHIHLLGHATPLMMVYFLLLATSDTPRSLLLAEGFVAGLLMDLTTSTPGMAAFAMTLTAFIQPILLNRIAETDRPDERFTPSIVTMGWNKFIIYATLITLVFVLTYFLLAWFTFDHLHGLFLDILGCSVITLLLIAALECIHAKL